MFSAHQLDTLQALVNRIIPADDDPSGWDGGVGEYLLRQFERDLKPMVQTYSLALSALDAEAQAVYGLDFTGLTAANQDDLLSHIEVSIVITHYWPCDPATWFHAAVEHCAEGYYGDPANGGNANAASWKMIGFEVRE